MVLLENVMNLGIMEIAFCVLFASPSHHPGDLLREPVKLQGEVQEDAREVGPKSRMMIDYDAVWYDNMRYGYVSGYDVSSFDMLYDMNCILNSLTIITIPIVTNPGGSTKSN